jgi:hypothetical protein
MDEAEESKVNERDGHRRNSERRKQTVPSSETKPRDLRYEHIRLLKERSYALVIVVKTDHDIIFPPLSPLYHHFHPGAFARFVQRHSGRLVANVKYG